MQLDIGTFQELFKVRYEITVKNNNEIIHDIVPITLIEHIQVMMSTVVRKGYLITKKMFESRLEIYHNELNRSNASMYFMKK
jgi:hypothetical protein